MRVIAGTAKGFRLRAPAGDATRPTLDRLRETLFNILMPQLPQSRFLDLFAGSGANGIEALSRGAATAVFVDQAPECIQVIRENLEHTRLGDRAEILACDYIRALSMLAERKQKFDLIFLDPPYQAGLTGEALRAIVKGDLLEKDGWVIVEHSAKTPCPSVEGLSPFREKSTHVTTMTFMTLEGNAR